MQYAMLVIYTIILFGLKYLNEHGPSSDVLIVNFITEGESCENV